jgi:hypothetical protein
MEVERKVLMRKKREKRKKLRESRGKEKKSQVRIKERK